MDEVKLLPCPFCGSQPEIMEGHRNHWRVECPRCGVRRAQFANGGIEEDKARAVRSWNHRPTTLVTDDVVERALAKAEAQIDENERAMIEERKGQYGSAFKAEQLVAIQGLHKQQRNGVKLARAAIASMPAVVSGGQSTGDHALPPSGLSQFSLSQSETAAAIARDGDA